MTTTLHSAPHVPLRSSNLPYTKKFTQNPPKVKIFTSFKYSIPISTHSTKKTPTMSSPQNDQNAEKCELQSLFAKESSAAHHLLALVTKFPSFADSRSQAVDWMLKVHDFYSFSPRTVILAVNYFDRFFARFGFPEGSKPWMTHLAAVACLSLAAKMEETYVPLLVDFQVEDAEYVFEAKTIQKTEILILSTLDWEMNAATPISFIEHLIRVFGFEGEELYTMCEDLLLRALADVEFVNFRPSVMAAAAMLNVVGILDPNLMSHIEKQILEMHEYDVEKVEHDKCCSFLQHLSSKYHQNRHNKRGFSAVQDSPKGVLDASFSSETSTESWASSPSASSNTEPISKRSKINHTQEDQDSK